MTSPWEKTFLSNGAEIKNRIPGYSTAWKRNQRVGRLLEVMGLHNPHLLNHSVGVASFALKLSRRLGFSNPQVDLIIQASLLHDIGKLNLPGSILAKPKSLTSAEYEVVKIHSELGSAFLAEHPDTHAVSCIVRHHHEFFNGQGYPDRISGEQIQIETRVVSIADAIDAMSSNRPYRRALSRQQIIDELNKGTNIQFDPLLVEPAVMILKETSAI